MKYSKIIRENFQNKFTYLVTILFSVTLFVLLCFGSINLNLITTWFSGGTNIEEAEYTVIYYANMPEGVFTAVKFKMHGTQSTHIITDNEFGTPSGYEFIGWNTEKDGSGIMYQKGDVLNLVTNCVMYAQWRSISSETPDDNLDFPEEDDNVEDEPTTDNDTPEDDNVGNNNTSDDNIDNGSDDNNTGDNSLNVGTGGNSSSGGGNGSSGSGGGSSSSGNTGSTTNSDNNKPSKPNNNSNNKDNNEENNKEFPKNYQFKFYNKKVLFSTTSCDVSSDGSCMLILPNNEPLLDGYSFIGWSLTVLCDKDIITESVLVNSSKDYYACYEINEDIEEKNNNIIYYIISIWMISGILIYFVIKKFIKNNVNINND